LPRLLKHHLGTPGRASRFASRRTQSVEAVRAFSSEVGTGSREENASKQKIEPRPGSIATEKALGMTVAQM
jgi:hypothetical protein